MVSMVSMANIPAQPPPRRRIALGLLLAGSAAPAHAYVGFIGPGGMLGVVLGILVGICLGLVFTLRQPRGWRWKSLTILPAVLAMSLASGVVGAVLGTVADLAYAAYLFRDFGKASEHTKLPLRQAACSGNMTEVNRILASSLNAKTWEHLARIAWECGVVDNPMPPRPAEVFDLLMPRVYRLYVQGQHGDTPGRIEDYCDVLDQLLWGRRVEQLQRLQQLNLPLHCRDGRGQLTLLRFLPERQDNARMDEATRAQFDAVLALIGGPQGPLKEAIMDDGQSFLDRAVAREDPYLILAALNAGIDPGRPDPSDGQPAAVDWALVKFRRCLPSNAPDRLTDADVAAIDRLLRPPTTEEINAFDTRRLRAPMLSYLHDFKECDDGGAAYFRTLRARGADLGVAFGGHGKKLGILHHFDDIKPALLHELERLTPLELDRLAHPRDPKSGIPGEPLMDTAVRRENMPLFKFLCERGVDQCEPSDPNLTEKAKALKERAYPEAAAQQKQRALKEQAAQDAAWQRYNESQECLSQCLPHVLGHARGSGALACPHCTVVPRPQASGTPGAAETRGRSADPQR